MTIYFFIFAGLLVAMALLIILPPLWRQTPIEDDDTARRNLTIARQRLAELNEQLQAGALTPADYDSQRAELELALSDDLAASQPRTAKPAGRWLAYLLLVAIPTVAGGLYARLGNVQALNPNAEMLGAQPNTPSLADIENMVGKLAERMKTDHDNAEGWIMLGKSYQYLQQYPKAAESFKEAYRLLGEQPGILLMYANALAFANGEQFAGQPAELIAKALTLEPDNATGLWLSGMAKAQAGDGAGAITLWRKLASLLPPGSKEQQDVQDLLAKVEKLPASEQPEVTAAITVQVSLAPELKKQAQTTDTVFVYAQALSGPKMPLAIVRKTVADLPLTVTLSDAQAMLPAMQLSNFNEVKLLARISKSGTATAQAGDLLGSIESVTVSDKTRHTLIINGAVK